MRSRVQYTLFTACMFHILNARALHRQPSFSFPSYSWSLEWLPHQPFTARKGVWRVLYLDRLSNCFQYLYRLSGDFHFQYCFVNVSPSGFSLLGSANSNEIRFNSQSYHFETVIPAVMGTPPRVFATITAHLSLWLASRLGVLVKLTHLSLQSWRALDMGWHEIP